MRVMEGLRYMLGGGRTSHVPSPGAPSFARSSASSSRRGDDVLEEITVPMAEDCSICLSPLAEGVIKTPCGHHFHAECLEQAFTVNRQPGVHPRCPLCRRPVKASMPVEARATSGRPIEVVGVPSVGSRCHIDRGYQFTSLGDFARPGMLYVWTPNEDRKTPASQVMWVVSATTPVIVRLNFRSTHHVQSTGAARWIVRDGWRLETNFKSTVSTGIPNGPYEGPVYAKRFEAGEIELYGSDTWEGTYFVFVEMLAAPVARGADGNATAVAGAAAVAAGATRGVDGDFMARVEAAERRDEQSGAEARSEAAEVETEANETAEEHAEREEREVDAAAILQAAAAVAPSTPPPEEEEEPSPDPAPAPEPVAAVPRGEPEPEQEQEQEPEPEPEAVEAGEPLSPAGRPSADEPESPA